MGRIKTIPAGNKDILFTKGLPANIDAERIILGAVMLDDTIWPNLRLSEDDFSLDSHRRIFRYMHELHDDGINIDRVTLANTLTRYGDLTLIGGLSYLMTLDEGLPKISNIDSYTKIVREKSILRRLMFASQSAIDSALAELDSVQQIVVKASSAIAGLEADMSVASDLLSAEQIFESAGGLQSFFTKAIKPGVSCGFEQIDEFTMGLQEQNGYVIAGRPGHGKTALYCNMMLKLGEKDIPSGLWSLEMSKEAILMRMCCAQAQVPLKTVLYQKTTPEQRSLLMDSAKAIMKMPIFIDETPGIHIGDLVRRINKACRERKLRVFGVDYIQIIDWQGDRNMRFKDEYTAITYFSAVLTMLARQNFASSVALSQLIKAPDKRDPSKRPTVAELKGSGGIEANATGIIFTHMPEKYKPGDEELRGKAEAIIAKSRNGTTGTAHLEFQGKYTRFIDHGKPLSLLGDED